jgi:nucleotide-binding universal stress UspA family protein
MQVRSPRQGSSYAPTCSTLAISPHVTNFHAAGLDLKPCRESSRTKAMRTIETILCPTDFSESSRAARDFAIELAKRFGAGLHLVHVFEPQPIDLDAGAPELSGQVFGVLENSAKARLAEEQKLCVDAGVKTEAELLVGSPARVIAELSDKVQLIVMSTHGRTGFSHFLMGSVTERVVRLAHCPVLTVPDPARLAHASKG